MFALLTCYFCKIFILWISFIMCMMCRLNICVDKCIWTRIVFRVDLSVFFFYQRSPNRNRHSISTSVKCGNGIHIGMRFFLPLRFRFSFSNPHLMGFLKKEKRRNSSAELECGNLFFLPFLNFVTIQFCFESQLWRFSNRLRGS